MAAKSVGALDLLARVEALDKPVLIQTLTNTEQFELLEGKAKVNQGGDEADCPSGLNSGW
jgi:hypothetical protein